MSESKRVTLKRGREKRIFVIDLPHGLKTGDAVCLKGEPASSAPWLVSKIEDTEIIARILLSTRPSTEPEQSARSKP